MPAIPFLRQLAERLMREPHLQPGDICVVFPGKRARLYLNRHLGEMAAGPLWAPRYYSIGELMEEFSPYLYADRLSLVFGLYTVYTGITGSHESFDRFYPYSEVILADFDEVDKYLVDARQLFTNLSQMKDLDGRFGFLSPEQVQAIRRFWSTFDPERTGAGQEAFLSLWKALPEVYAAFRESLHAKGIAYEGMAYRAVADRVREGRTEGMLRYRKYLFAGLNALSPSEETLLLWMKKEGVAEFYYDYDDWYVGDGEHEAGHFIRRNLKLLPPAADVSHDSLKEPKDIRFVAVASETGQANLLPTVFSWLGKGDGAYAGRTAVVLADESLLMPVLSALSEEEAPLNVTMGYPVASSAVYSLAGSLHQLVRNRRADEGGVVRFREADLRAVMSNPLIASHFSDSLADIRARLVKGNICWVAKDDLPEGHELVSLIYGVPSPHAADASAFHAGRYLLDIVDWLVRDAVRGGSAHPAGSLQLEILYRVLLFLTRLNDLIDTASVRISPDTLFRLVRRMMRTMRIPFSGEPLAGLQVMGLLETRCLDFDNVIMLSMNESVIPGSEAGSSFIPRSLRYGFGMPTAEHHDAVISYTFYRLIQRASKVVLVYNSTASAMQTGERSRLLHQLYYELPVQPLELVPRFTISRLPLGPIRVSKTAGVMKSLFRYTGSDAVTLTPSALNDFLDCGLRFYLRRVEGLKEQETITGEVDAQRFGRLLHRTMATLYGPLLNRNLDGAVLASLMKDREKVEQAILKAFSDEHLSPLAFNLVIRRILFRYVMQVIRTDVSSAPFLLEALEEGIRADLPFTVEGDRTTIRLGGIADRIDRHGNALWIVDYKTGSFSGRFPSVASLFDGESGDRNGEVFQVLLYAMVYGLNHPGVPVVPALLYVRESHREEYSPLIRLSGRELGSFGQVEGEFASALDSSLRRLFDDREDFVQTPNLNTCRYCPFTAICHRQPAG